MEKKKRYLTNSYLSYHNITEDKIFAEISKHYSPDKEKRLWQSIQDSNKERNRLLTDINNKEAILQEKLESYNEPVYAVLLSGVLSSYNEEIEKASHKLAKVEADIRSNRIQLQLLQGVKWLIAAIISEQDGHSLSE